MATRRQVVSAMSAAAVYASLTRPLVASRRSLDRIGIQLYTVRSAMRENVEQTLAQIAEIGYTEVEFAGYFERTASHIRSLLDHNGLTAPATHIDLVTLEQDWARTADFASTIGHEYVVVAWIAENERQSLDDYRHMADRFNAVGERARGDGFTFGYHNHAFEFQRLEGQVPYDVLLANTDPELVVLELDLFWIIKGGGDPVAYFASHSGRIQMVHVKDMDHRGNMVDVGKGQIDFASLFARREQAGIKHFFVEHDEPADPLASARDSYNYLRQLEF